MSPNLTSKTKTGENGFDPIFVISINDGMGSCRDSGVIEAYQPEARGWKKNQYLASLAG